MGDGSHQEVGGEGNEEVSTCRRVFPSLFFYSAPFYSSTPPIDFSQLGGFRMNFLKSTSSLRILCDYYVSPAPCKPLSGGASPLDGSSGTGPLMNQSKPKHLLERRDKDGSLRNQRRSRDSFSN
ncbi:hypothetical protein FRX31_007167 [Thalictrum thalictroides]|uniref:Uncharacterized protein n=1 Tax=Thalictrum thalictroides TaxID=46969 RepID=A0A7J6WE51_THATH|nr:hypothetical protein FRX31_014792 [Thalictrum thalictroides]KAF5203246.1 hypothetical protein FRX31_007167 [Thalictrum thalictroides]